MIIMALDHVRDYLYSGSFFYDPLDLTKTSGILFFTRWITHFCAPIFMLLAGTSAYLIGQKKTKKELSIFLVKRGLWLIFLEMFVVNFGWNFNGPIKKDRAFFFANVERLDQESAESAFITGAPVLAQFNSTTTSPYKGYLLNVRGDFKISDKNNMFARFSRDVISWIGSRS